ncbi:MULTISPECIES: hypothetical protein [unclassified Rathayibacter]|uniref:hypothetical protein n=1 Tax=unclassified Rathayibacter TaxID=2609250 RepID=UPI0015E48EEE|nr:MULTISPECIES: hypothetical protein [unclassified Rathayibacter]
MGIVHRYTRTQQNRLSFLAVACTTLRAVAALVQTTVNIRMLEVVCTSDASMASFARWG